MVKSFRTAKMSSVSILASQSKLFAQNALLSTSAVKSLILRQPNRENGFIELHRVAELTRNRPVQQSSTCQSGTQHRVLSIWGRGSGRVSQVPCLGNAIVVVGVKKLLILFYDLPMPYLHASLRRLCP